MSSTSPRRSSTAGPRRVHRLNLRALAILAAVLLLVVASLAAVILVRSSGGQDRLIQQARQGLEAGRGDLALSYLSEALRKDPTNLEALDLKAELLTKGSSGPDDLKEALRLSNLALNQNADQELARKIGLRQIDLNLKLGNWTTAETVAKAMQDQAPDDPEVLRLAAMTKEARAATSNDPEGFLNEALALYEKALGLKPDDVQTAARLAALYLEKRNDPERGLAALESVLAAAPEDTQAHLVMHRFQAESARRATAAGQAQPAADAYARADAELARALEIKGDDPEVRLAAADYALRRGQPEVALGHLNALPEADRKRPAVQALIGLCQLQRNQPELALEAFRSGLLESHGTDADLTWRMAVVQLKRGKLDEAQPLIAQYRRLAGGEEAPPALAYLEGLDLLRRNQPKQAIERMEATLEKTHETLRPEMLLTLGQAYEAAHDYDSAINRYEQAVEVAPGLPAPRLALIRLLQTRRPGLARELMNRTASELANEPTVRIASARAAFAEQAALPPDRRDWSKVEQLVARAAEVAPGASALALLQADLLSARGQDAEAIELLERATALQKSDPELWLARARRLSRAGRADAGLAALEQALDPSAAGDQAALRIERARLLTLRGRGVEARTSLVTNLDHLPASQHAVIYAALGDLYAAQRETEKATQAYNKWADLSADDPTPRLFLIQQARARGDSKAVDVQIQKLKESGGEQSPFYRIARIQELLRAVEGEAETDRDARIAEAQALIDALERDSPDRFGPVVRGQLLEFQGREEEAVTAFEQALARDGGRAVLSPLIRLYTKLGRGDQIDRLRRDYGVDAPNLDRGLAENALRSGDAARAEQLAREIVQTDPVSFETRIWQVRMLNTLGKADDAEASLRQYIALQPSRAEPRLALVAFLANRGQTDRAIRAAEDLIAEVKGLERPALVHAQTWRLAGQVDKADAAYDEALKADPDDADVIRAVADYYEASGRPAQAERVLRDYLGRKPQERWAARALALLRSARPGDQDAWREAWALILAAEPGSENTPEERLARGIVLARSADEAQRQQAVSLLSGLVLDLPAEYPSAAVARNVLSGLYARDGRFDKMAEVVAIDARPLAAAPASIVRYAEALLAAGQLDEAASQIDRLETAAPADPSLPLLRARLLAASGKKDEAASKLAEALSGLGEAPEARVQARRLLAAALEIDPAAAESMADRMAETWPATRWMRAVALARQGKPAEALDAYRDAAGSADPADFIEIGRNTLGLATVGTAGRSKTPEPDLLDAAEQVLDALIARAPEDPQILVLKGYLRHFQARYDEEVAFYEQANKLNPTDFSYLNNLAWSLSEGLKRPEDALPWIEQAFASADRVYPEFYDTRGVIYTRLGQLEQAINDLELAARLRPVPSVFSHLARAYHKAGRMDDFAKARELAKQAGLTPEQLDPIDRDEIAPLIFGDNP